MRAPEHVHAKVIRYLASLPMAMTLLSPHDARLLLEINRSKRLSSRQRQDLQEISLRVAQWQLQNGRQLDA